MIARRLRIYGRVQGVWYRAWTMRSARELGVIGWVRNREDGTVEALAIGEADMVERFIAACHEGSPQSQVERVDIAETDVETLVGFDQRETV